jgi:hypothetical protein
VRRLVPWLLLLALAACGGDEDTGPGELPEGEVSMRVLVPPTHRCTYEPAEDLVIRDSAAWAATWRRISDEMTPRPLPPDVDFGKEMVLASFLGPGPAGRAVRIREAAREGDRIVVTVDVREGKPDGEPTASGPCSVVAVPRSDLEVEWRRVVDGGE